MRTRIIALALSLCGLGSASAPVYQLTTVAGSDLVGDGGTAAAAQLAQPEGIVVDPAGNVYIADAANHRVREVTAAGVITTVAGNGHAGFSGDGGPAIAAQLNQPYGLALDASGNLYIADLGNQRVRRIGADGVITTAAGGDDGAQLLSPRNLAIDAAGNLYVSEFAGHRVQRIAKDGVVSTFAGTGIAGFSGDGGPAIAAQLAAPAGLAFDGAGALYIVDTVNYRVRKVQGGVISTVCDQSKLGVPNPQLAGIAADAAGDLYIPEKQSDVWKLSAAGTLAPAFTTLLGGVVDDVALAAGSLYFSQGRQVFSIGLQTGTQTTLAGSGTFGFSGDGGSALQAVLNGPVGLAFYNGAIYIADQGNQRVRAVAGGGTISTVAGNGQASDSGDGLAATSATLNAPSAVAFDTAGNLYITDSARVRQVEPSGVIITAAGCDACTGFGAEGGLAVFTPVARPQGVAADASGNLYVADTGHHRVLRVNPDATTNTVAGTGTAGFTGDGSTSASLIELNGPTGLALDANGNLYIADTQNHRVRMLTPDGVISTLAGTGTSGFSGDGGAAQMAEVSYPCAVAVDAAGDLFIADSGNNRVREVTPDGNIATIAGTGVGAYSGDSGAALEVALYSPCGLALDGQGNVLVADTSNNRVRVLAPTAVAPPPQLMEVTLASAASLAPGALAPGEIFSIFGQGIGPSTAALGAFDASGMLTTTLGNVQVLFDSTPAPLFYVQATQINAQVPYEMAGQGTAQVQIIYQGATIASMQISLAAANPALFTLGSGTGAVVAVNEDGTINSDAYPARRGSIVVLYATGEGQTTPAGVTGQAAQAPYGMSALGVSLTIAGISADVLWAGTAPGFVGLMQINARVPSGFVPTGDLPVVLAVGPYQSPAGLTIAVD